MVIRALHRRLRHALADRDRPIPGWLRFALYNPLRRAVQRPERFLRPCVAPGDRVLDLGPGVGFCTLPLARLVAPGGSVLAADIRPPMLHEVARRARRRGLAGVRTAVVGTDPDHPLAPLAPDDRFDFVLMFWMLHEVRNREAMMRDVRARLSDRAALLLAEPLGHVRHDLFEREIALAERVGFRLAARLRIPLSRAALLHPR